MDSPRHHALRPRKPWMQIENLMSNVAQTDLDGEEGEAVNGAD